MNRSQPFSARFPFALRAIRDLWFLLALGAVIGLAYLLPEPTPRVYRLLESGKTAAIICIFLVSGLTLPTQVLWASVGHWRLHLFVQGFNLVLIPAWFVLLRPWLLQGGMDPVLADGFVILGCVPTTIASSVAMTAMAGGNQAGAVCNSTLGNLLGVVVSPLLVFLLLSLRGSLDLLPVIRQMMLLVVGPILIGQICRLPFKNRLAKHRARLSVMSQFLLLLVIYRVFADTFNREAVFPENSLTMLIFAVAASHFMLLALNWRLSGGVAWRFDRADRIAALMCGTQKTVALGIPLVTVIYAHSPLAGLVSIPLLCYHTLQLLAGTVLAVILGRRPGACRHQP